MGDFTPQVRAAVRQRSRGRCERCRIAVATDMHHKRRRREGDHSAENAAHLCRSCHRFLHEHPRQAKAEGFIVSGQGLELGPDVDGVLGDDGGSGVAAPDGLVADDAVEGRATDAESDGDG